MTLALDVSARRVLVTGAGQGLGRGLALAFGAAGAEVLINDARADRAEAVADEIIALHESAKPASFDVTDFDAVLGCIAEFGPVEVLVNNAGNAGAQGFLARTPFAETGPDDWEPFLQVNLYGVLHCTRAAIPTMMANGWGRIITVISDAARTGDKYSAVYGAAKAAAAGLTRSVAREAGPYGVTANNIALGAMYTPLTERLWSEQPDSAEAKAILRNYVIRALDS